MHYLLTTIQFNVLLFSPIESSVEYVKKLYSLQLNWGLYCTFIIYTNLSKHSKGWPPCPLALKILILDFELLYTSCKSLMLSSIFLSILHLNNRSDNTFYFVYILLFKHSRLRAKKGPAPPLGNFADISYLKQNFKPHLLRDVCTLCSGALVSDSLLHMLL